MGVMEYLLDSDSVTRNYHGNFSHFRDIIHDKLVTGIESLDVDFMGKITMVVSFSHFKGTSD